MASLLISCVATGCVTTEPVGVGYEFCDIAAPIYIGRQDVLTDKTADQILALNETWKRLCTKTN